MDVTNIKNLDAIENALHEVEKTLKEMVLLSFEKINRDPNCEKELFSLWAKHAENLTAFFMKEAEKSGNEKIAKKITKYAMFKKF